MLRPAGAPRKWEITANCWLALRASRTHYFPQQPKIRS
jgi:hypothetical protein